MQKSAASTLFGSSPLDRTFLHLASEDSGVRKALVPVLREAAKWQILPEGWTQDSVKKFWESLTGEAKHKVTKCMKEMEGKVDNTGAFCGSLADKVDPGWRSRRADLTGTFAAYLNQGEKLFLEDTAKFIKKIAGGHAEKVGVYHQGGRSPHLTYEGQDISDLGLDVFFTVWVTDFNKVKVSWSGTSVARGRFDETREFLTGVLTPKILANIFADLFGSERRVTAAATWDNRFISPEDARTFGDRRYKYVPFHELNPKAQQEARRAYPYKSNPSQKYDFRDEHYYYPVDKEGNLAKARRTLAIPHKMILDENYMKSLGYQTSSLWNKVPVPRDVALLMDGWHESMSDPIYQVASNALAGHPVDADVVKAALDKIQKLLDDAKRNVNGWGPEEAKDLSRGVKMLTKVLQRYGKKGSVEAVANRYLEKMAGVDPRRVLPYILEPFNNAVKDPRRLVALFLKTLPEWPTKWGLKDFGLGTPFTDEDSAFQIYDHQPREEEGSVSLYGVVAAPGFASAMVKLIAGAGLAVAPDAVKKAALVVFGDPQRKQLLARLMTQAAVQIVQEYDWEDEIWQKAGRYSENLTKLQADPIKVSPIKQTGNTLEIDVYRNISFVVRKYFEPMSREDEEEAHLEQLREEERERGWEGRSAASPIGQEVYLDRDQARMFGANYTRVGEKLAVAADTLLRSKDEGYDEEHVRLLKPLGGKTLVLVGRGSGWFTITQVV